MPDMSVLMQTWALQGSETANETLVTGSKGGGLTHWKRWIASLQTGLALVHSDVDGARVLKHLLPFCQIVHLGTLGLFSQEAERVLKLMQGHRACQATKGNSNVQGALMGLRVDDFVQTCPSFEAGARRRHNDDSWLANCNEAPKEIEVLSTQKVEA